MPQMSSEQPAGGSSGTGGCRCGYRRPDISWYARSFRKLFFDFHSSEYAVGLASAFDAEAWAERVEQAGAQAVSVFTKCGFGWSFYRKGSIRYVHPHLPEGLDMLGEQIAALQARGIRTIGYYHVFNSEPLAREQPEWCCRDAQGQPRQTGMCTRGPLLEEWMLPHVAEIVTNYAVDSMFFDGLRAHDVCYCEHCRRRFRDEVGRELPSGPEDDSWRPYVEWSLEDHRRIRQRVSDTIHALRPEVVVSYNWAYSTRQPEAIPEHVDALNLDIPPEDQIFNGSYQARHWAWTGKPYDIMNSAFLQWWGDWCCKPAVAMQHEVATAIANGGLTWIGYQMTHTFDVEPAAMAEMGKTLAFVREREPLLEGATARACVAVLRSTESCLWEPARFMADEMGLRGAHKVLTETGLPHHFVDEQWLTAHVRDVVPEERCPVVVLADQRGLTGEVVAALERYVEEGGGLLVTARTGTLGPDHQSPCEFALRPLVGVDLVGEIEESHCYVEVTDPTLPQGGLAMPHLCEGAAVLAAQVSDDVQRLAELRRAYLRGDGQFLLRWSPPGERTGHPAITFRRVGRGAAAFVAVDLFRAYHVKNVWPLKHIAEGLVRRLAPGLPVRLTAPAWLEVALAEQDTPGGTRTIVHLVNYHGNGPVDRNNLCIEQTLPVRDVTLELRRAEPPAAVTLEPGGSPADWEHGDGVLTVRIPEVRIHLAVVVT